MPEASHARRAPGGHVPTVVPLAPGKARGECYGGMNRPEALNSDEHPRFARMFREHYPALVSFVRRRVASDAEAADIAQEAYLRILRYRDEEDVTILKALLFRIAMNLIGMQARSARFQRRAEHIPLDETLSLATDDPPQDRQAAGAQELDRLTSVVKLLPRKCQRIFILSRFHGLTHPQIAARLGISIKSVEKHITKALALCRRKVGGEWS